MPAINTLMTKSKRQQSYEQQQFYDQQQPTSPNRSAYNNSNSHHTSGSSWSSTAHHRSVGGDDVAPARGASGGGRGTSSTARKGTHPRSQKHKKKKEYSVTASSAASERAGEYIQHDDHDHPENDDDGPILGSESCPSSTGSEDDDDEWCTCRRRPCTWSIPLTVALLMIIITIPPFAVGRFFELTEVFDKMQAFSVSVGIETAMKSLEMVLATKANGFTTVVLMAASDVRDGDTYDIQAGVPPLNGHSNEFNIPCNTTLPTDNTSSRIIPGNCLSKDSLLFMLSSDGEALRGSVDNVYPPFGAAPSPFSTHLNPPFPRWSQWMVAISGIQTSLLSTAEEPTIAFVHQPSKAGITTPTNRPSALQYVSTSSTIEPLTKEGKLTASVRPLLRFGKFNCSGVTGEVCEGFTQDLLPTIYYNAIVTGVYPDPTPSSSIRYSRSGTFDDYRLTATKDITLLDSDYLLSVRDEGVSMVEGTTPLLSSALSFSDTGTPLLTLATHHLTLTNANSPNADPSYIGSMTFRLSVDGLSTLFRRAVDSIPWGESGGTLGTEWFLVWSSSASSSTGGSSSSNDFVVASSVWNASNIGFAINTRVSSRREEWLLMTTRKLCYALEGNSATPTGFFEGDALLKARVAHAGGVRASPSAYTDAYLDAPISPPKEYRCIKQVSDVPFAPLQYVYSNSAFEDTIRTNSVQSFAVDWFVLRSDVSWLDLEMYTFVSIAVKFGSSISTNDPRISIADSSSVGVWKVLFFIPQFGSWQFVLGSLFTAVLPSLLVGFITWVLLQYGLYDFVMRGVRWATRDDADIQELPRFSFDPQGISHAVGVFLQDVYITVRAQPMLLNGSGDDIQLHKNSLALPSLTEAEGNCGGNANTRAVLNTLNSQLTTSIDENQCGGVCCFCENEPDHHDDDDQDDVSGGSGRGSSVMEMPDPCRHCLNHNIPQGKGWWQRVRAPLYENIVGPIMQVASRVRTPALLTTSTAPCVYCGLTEVRTQRPTGNDPQQQSPDSESDLSQLLSLDAPLNINSSSQYGSRLTTHNHSVSISGVVGNGNAGSGGGIASNGGGTSAGAVVGNAAAGGPPLPSGIPNSVDMGDGCVIKRVKIQPEGSMPHRPRSRVSFSNSDSLPTNVNMVPQNQPAIFVRIDFEPLISHYLAQGGCNQTGGGGGSANGGEQGNNSGGGGANEDEDQVLPTGLKSPLHKVHSDLYEAILHVMRAYGVVVPNSFSSQVPPNGLHVPSQNSEQSTTSHTKNLDTGAVSPLGINITQRNTYYQSNPLPPSKPGPSGRQIARVSGVVTNDLAKASQRYQDYIEVFSSANTSTQQLAAWAAMACSMELRSVCINILRAHIVGFSLATAVPPTTTLTSPNTTVVMSDLPASGSDTARRQSVASLKNPIAFAADASFSGLEDMPTWADQQWSKVMATTQSVKEKIRQGMLRRGVAHSSTSTSSRATTRARGGAGVTTWLASLMPTLLVTSIDGGVTYSTASPSSIARANYDASLALDLTHLQQQLDVPVAVTGEVAKISVMGVGKYKKGGGGMAALWLQALVEAGTMPMRGNASLVIYELVPHAYVGAGIASPTSVANKVPQHQIPVITGVTLDGSNNQIFRTNSDLANTNLITSPSLDSNALMGAAGSGSRAPSPHTPRTTVVSILPTDSDPNQHSATNTAVNPVQPGPQAMRHLAAHGAACDMMRKGEYEAAIDAFLINATAISTQGIYETTDDAASSAVAQNHLTPLESALARHGMRLCEVCEEQIVTAKCKEIIIHPVSPNQQQKAFLSTRPPLPS